MKFTRIWSVFLVVICVLLFAACGDPAATPTPLTQPTAAATPQPGGNATPTKAAGGTGIVTGATSKALIVFAASSLKDAFQGMDADLKAKNIGEVNYNFAGSQTLAAQIKQGAVADVIAAADLATIDDLVAASLITTGTQRLMATNKLVVVVPSGSGQKVRTLNDLVKSGTKIVLADPAVPAGSYSLAALTKLSADKAQGADFKERVLANVVSRESNVRQVLAKVQLGEADAGIVYVTDAKSAAGKVTTIDIPDEYNVTAHYYIAPVVALPHATAGLRFIKYVISDAGQKSMQSFGFGPIK